VGKYYVLSVVYGDTNRKLYRGHVKTFATAGLGTMGFVVLFGALMYPFVPMISYSSEKSESLISRDEWIETSEDAQAAQTPENKETIQGNYLVISSIGVRVAISEGSDATALKHGAWRLPGTSNPESGSNMVLAAHRFRWNPPHEHTFYHLDKLRIGDIVQVFWEGKEYRYAMVHSDIVSPDSIEVLRPTESATISLVTCNPIFSMAERLVVTANLVTVI
jgi:sortase A